MRIDRTFIIELAILSLVIQKAVAGLAIATTLASAPVAPIVTQNNQASVQAAVTVSSAKLALAPLPRPATADCTEKECVQDMIEHYAAEYGVSSKLALAVAECESHFRTNVYGDNGLAYGVFQFHEGTFKLFAQELFRGEQLSYYDVEDSIKLAVKSIAHGKGSHWTCYRKATR